MGIRTEALPLLSIAVRNMGKRVRLTSKRPASSVFSQPILPVRKVPRTEPKLTESDLSWVPQSGHYITLRNRFRQQAEAMMNPRNRAAAMLTYMQLDVASSSTERRPDN